MSRPSMTPEAGERLLRFVGDRAAFSLQPPAGVKAEDGWRGFLRTNIGRAAVLREEIIKSYFHRLPLAGASWRDIPMQWRGGAWHLELPLLEVGWFKAKAYALDEHGRQHWPDGGDIGVAVHPDSIRTANTIYCAFTRMFGAAKSAAVTVDERLDAELNKFDRQGYTVIPPSGKLRDLTRELPHIVDKLGCRILHLLPVNTTPTTYARFGRFGSPYACEDLIAIDPALVEFDKRTTGVDQFCELTYATHSRGARVFLDVVINHTGWGSTLQENHPEWFLREHSGEFASPGAWGNIWADLVELEHKHPELWEAIAESFLVWCRRGVDGFRCDAGYKVPLRAWQYIIARVRQEFPEAIFLLEGLGGGWQDTENLLTAGGMQWAYSELFQEYEGPRVATYLDHALKQSGRIGVLSHYSETHDNNRLAAKGRVWSLLRNRLCALTSVSGSFGFTGGVEWLAAEKVNVHSSRGMSWGSRDNIIPELAALNRLLAQHPCFFDNVELTRLSPLDSQVYALQRTAPGGEKVLVLANCDAEHPRSLTLEYQLPEAVELLGQVLPKIERRSENRLHFVIPAGGVFCLGNAVDASPRRGQEYRAQRASAAWALQAIGNHLPEEKIGLCDWHKLAAWVEQSPVAFLASLPYLEAEAASQDLLGALKAAAGQEHFPQVVTWELIDRLRVTPVPAGHWLLVRNGHPFRGTLRVEGEPHPVHVESIAVGNGYLAAFPPRTRLAEAKLTLERFTEQDQHIAAQVRYLGVNPQLDLAKEPLSSPERSTVLLTNGIGGMARLCVDLGRVNSKYDCVLGANLHPSLPVDRHVLVKRVRVWVNADGFITPLDGHNLVNFIAGPPATWQFTANAGDGRAVEVQLTVGMVPGANTTVLRFVRPQESPSLEKPLPDACDVRLTIRFDIEDRNFHSETKRNDGAEHHFASHSRALHHPAGFAFTPASDRQLQVTTDFGRYHHEAEWSQNVPHPVEQSRGQEGSGDAYSPGWFEISLTRGREATITVAASQGAPAKVAELAPAVPPPTQDAFGEQLARALQAFVVRRGEGKTVIAGYPWFLDWGRDTLIVARGMLAAGMHQEVRDLLVTFGCFEQNGTLPNTIHGDNVSNRDTSDAPLWYGMVCEEAAAASPDPAAFYRTLVDGAKRTLTDVLASIATHYRNGTPNGIRMDTASGLVWSPSHFTWMDTNYPAGTPREGYPVEIQALWIRLLQQLHQLKARSDGEPWGALAERATESLNRLYWLEEPGYFADCLLASAGAPAASAVVDNALRSNCLLPVSLGLVEGRRAQRCVEAARHYLVIPGALRSLAPLPVSPPLRIVTPDGRPLNDPRFPYWGRYEGDEDTRRKPSYHNGTAWTWPFPVFCEALAVAWRHSPAALATARSYLGSMDRLMNEGSPGHLPEVLDGDAPHTQRGCDAQAWGVSEALRVWKLLNAH